MSKRMAGYYLAGGAVGGLILLGGGFALMKKALPFPAPKRADASPDRKPAPGVVDIQIVQTDDVNPFNKIVCQVDALPKELETNLEASADSRHPWKVTYYLTGGSATPKQLEYNAEKRGGQWRLTQNKVKIEPGAYQASVHALLSDGTEIAASKEQAFTVPPKNNRPILTVTETHESAGADTLYHIKLEWLPPLSPKRSDWKYYVYEQIYPNAAGKNDHFPAGVTPLLVTGASWTGRFRVPRGSMQRLRYVLEAKSGSLTVRSATEEKDIRYRPPDSAPAPEKKEPHAKPEKAVGKHNPVKSKKRVEPSLQPIQPKKRPYEPKLSPLSDE